MNGGVPENVASSPPMEANGSAFAAAPPDIAESSMSMDENGSSSAPVGTGGADENGGCPVTVASSMSMDANGSACATGTAVGRRAELPGADTGTGKSSNGVDAPPGTGALRKSMNGSSTTEPARPPEAAPLPC
ncbi:hypothetical protein [Myxococcus landrumensis]|uniref:hypothetical protein n=1 Tax=Myxococcus landrumensis TaxID=2813577 RepID=UPI001F514C59|nr:hypothetical protein [Myxococcus landrumus]